MASNIGYFLGRSYNAVRRPLINIHITHTHTHQKKNLMTRFDLPIRIMDRQSVRFKTKTPIDSKNKNTKKFVQ